MKKVVLASFLSAVVLSSGCASIVSDSNWPVAINSSPDGADFIVTDKRGMRVHSGRTPSTVTLKSGDGYFSSASYTVTIKKDGYNDKTFVIESSMNGWYVGNILFGGFIGWLIVDPLTGAMWKLPEGQTVTLDKTVATNGDEPALTIVSLDNIPEADRSKLVRVN